MRSLSNFYEAGYDPKSMQETEVEDLGSVSSAMTSGIKGTAGDGAHFLTRNVRPHPNNVLCFNNGKNVLN